MTRRFTNNAVHTALTSALTLNGSETTLNVGDTTGWLDPTGVDIAIGAVDYGNQTLVEIFSYTGKTGTTLTGVVRGLDGTAKPAHAVGALVRHVVSAYDFERILSGTFANRPAAGTVDRLYYATDTATLYQDTGAAWVEVAPGNKELGYAESTTSAAATSSTTYVDLSPLVSLTVTIGTKPVIVEVAGAPYISATPLSAVGNYQFAVMEGSTEICRAAFGTWDEGAATISSRRRLTPSAGNHTYKIQHRVAAASTTGTLLAAAHFPIYIRVTEVG